MLYTFQILTILIIMSTFEGHVSMSSIFSKFVGLSQEPIIHESVLVMFILFLFNKRMLLAYRGLNYANQNYCKTSIWVIVYAWLSNIIKYHVFVYFLQC